MQADRVSVCYSVSFLAFPRNKRKEGRKEGGKFVDLYRSLSVERKEWKERVEV